MKKSQLFKPEPFDIRAYVDRLVAIYKSGESISSKKDAIPSSIEEGRPNLFALRLEECPTRYATQVLGQTYQRKPVLFHMSGTNKE